MLIGFCSFFRKQRLLRIILKGFVFLLSAEEPHFKDGTPLDVGIFVNPFSNFISLGSRLWPGCGNEALVFRVSMLEKFEV